MSLFQIIYNGLVIGHTNFEFGDPPMGVAFGRFHPTLDYPKFQSAFASDPELSMSTIGAISPDGVPIGCAGFAIEDFSEELGESEIQVTALAISEPPYSDLFPQHVALYERQFPNAP